MDPFTAFIVNLIISLVLSAASSLIASMFQQDNEQKRKVPGVRGSIQKGGDHPLSFIMGFYGTAGHLKYAGTWGNSGETPNAYFSKVVSVSDLPVRGLAGFFVNGERVTLAASDTGDLGRAVLEYRVGGVDHLWVKFYDGSQTVADPLMRGKFGSDADRPYTSDMVGRGVAYFVATALVNRELFSNFPEYFAEINGIELDDPRGDDAHDNPMVGIHTIMQGIYYDGEWVYGPQNITDDNFVYANLEAQMDKCDALISLDGGGTQKRFRFGLEVSVDAEPQAIIGEYLKACEGRVAEIGGVYKFLVGEPDAAVVSITDEDTVITDGQNYDPFPGLESLYNGIAATYPEPAEAWENKEAPPRYRSDLESLDDGRRLPFSADYKAVPFAVQVQQLMRAAIEETRRFRKTTKTMPPEFWEYEPLDSYSETSIRNGWTDKLFLITAMDDLPNGNQFIGAQEADPADYAWDSEYQLPWDISPLVIARPTPQIMTGWDVQPYTHVDSDSQARRPGIEVLYAAGLLDVRSVRVQVRRSGETAPFFDGEYPYDPADPAPSNYIISDGLLPAQAYEARGIFTPFSGRVTEWSAWLAVTTPNVKLGANDIDITFADIAAEIVEKINSISIGARDAARRIEELGTLLSEQDIANFNDQQSVKRDLQKKVGDLEAGFVEFIEVALGPGGAIATSLSTLYAAMGGDSAQVLIRYEAVAAPAGVSARWAVQVSSDGSTFASAGMYLDLMIGGATRIVLAADQTVVASGDGTQVFALFDEDGLMVRDITSAMITSADGYSFWDLENNEFQMASAP